MVKVTEQIWREHYTFSVPSPTNASYVGQRLGRAKEVHGAVGAIAEEPTFVDNAIHHVVYETTEDTGKSNQVSKPNQADFQPTHPRRYRISEEQSAVRLAHTTHEDAPFFNGEQMSATSTRPMLLIDTEDVFCDCEHKVLCLQTKGRKSILST